MVYKERRSEEEEEEEAAEEESAGEKELGHFREYHAFSVGKKQLPISKHLAAKHNKKKQSNKCILLIKKSSIYP